MPEHIPTTEQVKKGFVQDRAHDNWVLQPQVEKAFEAWLAQHDAEVLREFAEHVNYACPGIKRMTDENRCYCDVAEWARNKADEIIELRAS